MKLTEENYEVMLERAENEGACPEDIETLHDLSFGEALNHPQTPYWAYFYANRVIMGRWPEAEKYIKTNPVWAYFYANRVIMGRWPEAEKYIKTNPVWAYLYVNRVIMGRWPEAEKYIKTNHEYWGKYKKYVSNQIGDEWLRRGETLTEAMSLGLKISKEEQENGITENGV